MEPYRELFFIVIMSIIHNCQYVKDQSCNFRALKVTTINSKVVQTAAGWAWEAIASLICCHWDMARPASKLDDQKGNQMQEAMQPHSNHCQRSLVGAPRPRHMLVCSFSASMKNSSSPNVHGPTIVSMHKPPDDSTRVCQYWWGTIILHIAVHQDFHST